MPELLVGQSIGLDRLEVIAVDDGSTDRSGAELDRFAEQYPDTVKVIHQANSGGPAAPSNRALDIATGRYVYFIGSDDYLGEEALARMVACADENDSDVVIGKMVGTNGRYVHQKLYKKNDPDISLFRSDLPFTLANTKLFRRELVEKHGLRFPEDVAVGSDQPFTIEACVRARKISVLSDYTFYYAVKRGDASNITYRADHLSRLRCTEAIMKHAASLVAAGPDRDALFKRHFTWELAKLVGRISPHSRPAPSARSARESPLWPTRTSPTDSGTPWTSSAGCGSASPRRVPSTSWCVPSPRRRSTALRPSTSRTAGPSRCTPASGTMLSVSPTGSTSWSAKQSRAGSLRARSSSPPNGIRRATNCRFCSRPGPVSSVTPAP